MPGCPSRMIPAKSFARLATSALELLPASAETGTELFPTAVVAWMDEVFAPSSVIVGFVPGSFCLSVPFPAADKGVEAETFPSLVLVVEEPRFIITGGSEAFLLGRTTG